jgi:probable HAF family extracellular repeat protein
MKTLPLLPKSFAISCLALAAVVSLANLAAAADHRKGPVMPFASGIRPGASRQVYAHAPNVTTINLPGATASYALGINNKGEAVGYWYDDQFNTHGFLYSGGKVTHRSPQHLRHGSFRHQ